MRLYVSIVKDRLAAPAGFAPTRSGLEPDVLLLYYRAIFTDNYIKPFQETTIGKTRCILHYSRVCHSATSHGPVRDGRTRTGMRRSATVPISVIYCC